MDGAHGGAGPRLDQGRGRRRHRESFGRLEAARGGSCDAIRVASETRTPLIIAVPAFDFERWTRCSHGMTVRLDCALDPVLEWWRRVSARNPRMLASELRACELLK